MAEAGGGRDLEIIDAHQHFWDIEHNYLPWLRDEPPIPFRYGDYRALRRNYLPADYARDTAGFRIVGSVYVEAEWDRRDPVAETRWVDDLTCRAGLPSVVVAHAALDRADVAEVLAAHAAFPRVRGIRHKPAAAADPASVEPGAQGSMGDPAWRRGYALLAAHGLSFDLQTPWWHLKEAADLATAFPQTQVILNHTGLPADRSEAGLAGWRRAMASLAECPNVAVKISGIGLPGRPWTVADNGPVVRTVLELFGTDRAMFASNYPVDGLVASFATIFDGFLSITADLPPADRRALFALNARRIYRIVD
jgi:predicted TIM-barrel fold metal-dependent hydrolase